MQGINYKEIQKEINENKFCINEGTKDIYAFTHELTVKYIKPTHPECMDCEDENPFADLLFAMFEINGLKFY